MDWTLRPIAPKDEVEWLRMRLALWPDHTPEELQADFPDYCPGRPDAAAFVIERPDGRLGGFLEASQRAYANGCNTSPVGYIEGWYVDPDLRLQGAGGALVRAAEQWALDQGCTEMASDCELDNEVSFHAHLKLGYQEANRLIVFYKTIKNQGEGNSDE